MIIDAGEISQNETIDADLCIVGAGAAGITLAREFIGKGLNVWLLESGGFEADEKTQSLYQGETQGLPYPPLRATRLRYFGGTTNHWAGWCRPPPSRAFSHRPWIPNSGWPFGRETLDSYFDQAHAICELGPYDYETRYWSGPETSPLGFMGNEVETVITQFSPPVRFGNKYRASLVRAGDISVCLHANVVRIDTDDNGRSVTALQVATLQGRRFTLRPRYCVLATGGIENARLMLDSNHILNTGVGNRHDLVGRYFMDHIKFELGQFQPSDPGLNLDFYTRHEKRGTSLKGNLRFSDDVLHREQILESYFELFPMRGRERDEVSKSVARFISASDDGPRDAEPAAPPPAWRVTLRLDPAPRAENRVSLSTDRDALGQHRARLDWRFGELEKRSFERAGRVLGRALGGSGQGRLRLNVLPEDRWPPPPGNVVATGFHHMGTTRMHDDPKQGVVDANCRVHGTSNLYIAGSSVFPTYEGYPTMTIVALTLRLADHVRGLFR